ncbi:YaaR family protein [Jeotgalibacillus soli]|uniref:DUF327 domain-containing protein n=1 Tax=Jeotgalibacillus soli TaxID=889306 RepID=A0A0C2W7C8_9BACL|nr:YaaR family protein [Jeotgalibacillus soli]KIL52491.1 hypothetical protein KP78_00260 [Jeotgalibacillus soli]
MKINQDLRLSSDQRPKGQQQSSVGQLNFGNIVQKQGQKMQVEQLTRLMGDVTKAGERLARSRNFKDLAKFKTLVRQLVKETVDFGMGLKESHSWNQYGEGRKLRIVETIEESLVNLTDDLMKNEKQSIDILDQIGEIKGLLINLYT